REETHRAAERLHPDDAGYLLRLKRDRFEWNHLISSFPRKRESRVSDVRFALAPRLRGGDGSVSIRTDHDLKPQQRLGVAGEDALLLLARGLDRADGGDGAAHQVAAALGVEGRVGGEEAVRRG